MGWQKQGCDGANAVLPGQGIALSIPLSVPVSTWKIAAASDSASDYMSPTLTPTQRSCFFYSEPLLEAAIFHLQMYADEHTHVYTLCHGCLL